ncbi:MBL fold metallo-hydrolase [Halarchaeum sp. CBA1220]|uniref:MBL fold metallo-hydrolase n=1 Tax=Halarchaeum sp. CBA1220 TaxID=1853682 RepID=UPI000F3A99E6|nr:MBL fold metallo-hydrolase [Halarchaeum sp. CBA1220]QLC34430.1 MBL fold metallo-hydrolase [Halarchaeum sp. CBA1220]
MTVTFGSHTLEWLGYACARVETADGTVVYTDPGRYGTLDGTWDDDYGAHPHPHGRAYDARDGDVVLVTHDHHYDDEGVRRVAKPDATVVVYEGVSAEGVHESSGRDVAEPEALDYDIERVAYGDHLDVAGVGIDVVPAYNRADGPRDDHPYEFGCGYRFVLDERAYFWTGDSDVVDEHGDLDVDVLLPSIAQSFTMDRHGAADLAHDLRPDLVLPVHYNTFGALAADDEAFAADVASRGVPVVLDRPREGE